MAPVLKSPALKRYLISLALLLFAVPAAADELLYSITGIDGALEANVRAHVEILQLGRRARLAESDYPQIIANAERRAREGLRPSGYYTPEVTGRIQRKDDETVVLTLDIRKGAPLIISSTRIELEGDGRSIKPLRDWRDNWPLRAGAVLDQAIWEAQKGRALEIAAAHGLLGAEFSERKLELDLINNTAAVVLVLDTGPQFMFGDVTYSDHILNPAVLEYIPRFSKGVPYSARLLDKFRIDLWKTGYFTNIEIREVEQPDESPPEVDIFVAVETEHKNAYQGALGFGSDTGIRLQAQWSRHPVSRKGDRLDVGVGWQEKDDKFSLRTNYRLPRLTRDRQFWVGEFTAKFENTDLEVKRRPEDDEFIRLANGDVEEQHVRLGRLRVRNLKRGDRQLFATPFVQFLHSDQEYGLITPVPQLESDNARLLKIDDFAVSIGYEVDLADVWGKGFDVEGRRDRAVIFASDEALGSSADFLQAYISTRRVMRRGDDWKLLVRGEIGYTDAVVDNLSIDVENERVDLSLTQLPHFYRFKAGGSQSVRGYGFETLNNNDVGSNNIITASVEVERRFLDNWSAAAFLDIGNAFNDWSNIELRKGVGVGIRWYSIAGPIRVDVAQALDVDGRPWRVHFTIGTSLL